MQDETLPSLKEELERKTVETLQWVISMRETGQMTAPQAKVAIQTAFGIVAGLVSEDTMSILDELKGAKNANEVIRRFFYRNTPHGPDIVILSWTVGTETIKALERKAYSESIKIRAYTKASPKEAEESLSSMCELISVKGAIEL